MKKTLIAVSLSAIGIFSTAAHAQSVNAVEATSVTTKQTTNSVKSTDWASRWANSWTNDVYVGANIGHSNVRHLHGVQGVSVDNSDTSYGVFAGYQFHKNFAAELDYTKLGDFGTSFGDIKANSWDLSLVGNYPIYKNLSATARVGAAFTEAKFAGERNSHTTAVYGLGLEYAVNKNVSLSTGWNRYHNFADTNYKLDNVSVGLKYKF